MARIKTYSNDTVVVANDKWIGSDSQAKFATKNYTAQSVADFINEKGNQLQSLRYKYKSTPPRNPGTISFSPYKANNVPFSTITSWILSDSELKSPEDISSFYSSPLVGSDVLVTQCDDITQWAIYEWDSVTDVPNEKLFSNIGLSYRTGLGGLINDEDYFISLLSYASNTPGDKNKVISIDVASSVWILEHNLNKYPAVSIVNSANVTVYGDIVYDTLNKVTVTFNAAHTGKAFFN